MLYFSDVKHKSIVIIYQTQVLLYVFIMKPGVYYSELYTVL